MKMSSLSSTNFTGGNILLKELTKTINSKIKLHNLGVPMNKLSNFSNVNKSWPLTNKHHQFSF